MSFIINRVFPRYREIDTIETKLREFELQCADKCQNLIPIEFKTWLDHEIDRDVLKSFAARKCNYRTSPYLDIDELYESIDKITEYIYTTYRYNYSYERENILIANEIDSSYENGNEEESLSDSLIFDNDILHASTAHTPPYSLSVCARPKRFRSMPHTL